MLNKDKKNRMTPQPKLKKETQDIEAYSPVHFLKRNAISKAFEAALEAVSNMGKKKLH